MQAPLGPRHLLAGRIGRLIADDQTAVLALDVRRRVVREVGQLLFLHGFVRGEQRAHHRADRAAVLAACAGCFQTHLIFLRRHVELPADIQHREALLHQRRGQARPSAAIGDLHPGRAVAA